MENSKLYVSCDVCGAEKPRFVLESNGLDGPLVECTRCGFRYVGKRRSDLTFGKELAETTTARVRNANSSFHSLGLDEEGRLARLNAKWRLDLIRRVKPSGKLLEAGCARGDFLAIAREWFDAYGVEPNPELAAASCKIAPVHQDTIEHVPWAGFDVVASFHVIEHVDSPRSFIRAAAARIRPGGLLVIETPNIDSLPFKVFKTRWRQFIPEHYFFFDPKTIGQVLSANGFEMRAVMSIGKYASLNLLLNRLSRYLPWMPSVNGISRLTFRMNPLDIMLVFATKHD
jgi:2-polyprenyl-3-methyl-5-hydroxy-6-metoxy-1,4-benzoquinol methylase